MVASSSGTPHPEGLVGGGVAPEHLEEGRDLLYCSEEKQPNIFFFRVRFVSFRFVSVRPPREEREGRGKRLRCQLCGLAEFPPVFIPRLTVPHGLLTLDLRRVADVIKVEDVVELSRSPFACRQQRVGPQRTALYFGDVHVPQREHGEGLEQLPGALVKREHDRGLVRLNRVVLHRVSGRREKRRWVPRKVRSETQTRTLLRGWVGG